MSAAPAGLEDQLTLLGGEGGLLSSPGSGWLWAFPIASLGGASGCLVVSSPDAPPQHERALLQALAQQTGVTVSQARLLQRERGCTRGSRTSRRRSAGWRAGLARGAAEEVFAAVAAEAGRLLGRRFAVMSRYGPDGAATVVGAWTKGDGESPSCGHLIGRGARTSTPCVSANGSAFAGRRLRRRPEHGPNHRPAVRVRSVVGVPIDIGGRLWGQSRAASRRLSRCRRTPKDG